MVRTDEHLFKRFLDAVASLAFGHECPSLENTNGNTNENTNERIIEQDHCTCGHHHGHHHGYHYGHHYGHYHGHHHEHHHEHHTVRRFYFATAVFALFLCEILIKFYTQWQF